jgi:hypothetical protein
MGNPELYKESLLSSVPAELQPIATAMFDGDFEKVSRLQEGLLKTLFRSHPEIETLYKQFTESPEKFKANFDFGQEKSPKFSEHSDSRFGMLSSFRIRYTSWTLIRLYSVSKISRSLMKKYLSR